MPLKFIVLQKCYICTLLVLGANLAIVPNLSYAIAPQESRGDTPAPAPEPAVPVYAPGENYQLPITNYQLPITNYQLIAQNPIYPPLQQYNPPPLPNTTIQIARYVVYVNGDSPLLLQFVQQVEPAATVLLYKQRRVIAAGSFFDEISAQQRVLQLKSIGVQAEITNFQDSQEFSNLIPLQQPNYYPVPPIIPPTQQPNYTPIPPNYLAPNNPGIGTGLYQVVVDPSIASLAQVQRVESRAFRREYGGVRVIQAGSFGDQFNAQKRVERLAARGIAATVVRSGQANSNQTPFPSSQPQYIPPAQIYIPPAQTYTPPAQNLTQNNANYYFVVVSGNRGDLTQIRQEILRLGIPGETVVARDIGGDPHVKVGPFSDQSTAERWERYLRDSGIKTARVYFGQY